MRSSRELCCMEAQTQTEFSMGLGATATSIWRFEDKCYRLSLTLMTPTVKIKNWKRNNKLRKITITRKILTTHGKLKIFYRDCIHELMFPSVENSRILGLTPLSSRSWGSICHCMIGDPCKSVRYTEDLTDL